MNICPTFYPAVKLDLSQVGFFLTKSTLVYFWAPVALYIS
jgi:hypothetical protein